MGIPPTSQGVSFGVIDTLRIVDGKLVEHWGQMDSMTIMQQPGAIPSPGEGEGHKWDNPPYPPVAEPFGSCPRAADSRQTSAD